MEAIEGTAKYPHTSHTLPKGSEHSENVQVKGGDRKVDREDGGQRTCPRGLGVCPLPISEQGYVSLTCQIRTQSKEIRMGNR